MAQRTARSDPAAATRPSMTGVVAAAFRRLLDTGRPVESRALAGDLDAPVESVEETLAEAAGESCIRRFPGGGVHGAVGLSVVPTRHVLLIAGSGPRYTWCAYDALGIMAALGASGRAVSISPWSGRKIVIRFAGGQLVGPERAVLFLAACSGDVLARNWCPYVNLFASAAEVRRWTEEFGVEGRVVALEDGREQGAGQWRPIVRG